MLIGLFARPVAFILSGEMAVAYFQFHAQGSFWPTVNSRGLGRDVLLRLAVLLRAQARPWSVDAMRQRTAVRP